MSNQPNDGGPAFPCPDTVYPNGQVQPGTYGMSLRDYFAGQALIGLLAAEAHPAGGVFADEIDARSQYAYEQADAMLAARSRQGGGAS